jgi:protein TonB
MPHRLLKHLPLLSSLAIHGGLVGVAVLCQIATRPADRPALLLGVESREFTGSVDVEPPDVTEPVVEPMPVVDPIPDVVPDAPTPDEAAEPPPSDDVPVADSMPVLADAVPVGVRLAPKRATSAPSAVPAPSTTAAAAAPVRPVVVFAPSRRGAHAESRAAERIGNTPPAYPIEALRRHEEGTAILDVRVTAEGSVSEATIYESSGSRVLDDASISAALGYRYAPRLVDGVSAPDWLRVPFVWRLSGP